jgi:hypothetical protein
LIIIVLALVLVDVVVVVEVEGGGDDRAGDGAGWDIIYSYCTVQYY